MEPDELLRRLVAFFEQHGIAYFITGSVAAMAYGEPRFTNDVDLVVDLEERHADAFCAAFPPPDFYVSRAAVLGAIRNRHQFNLIHVTGGVKADVILPHATEFDRSRWARRRRMPLGTVEQPMLASPEDVILKKMEYFAEGGSEKHLRDITGILKLSSQSVDRAYIEQWAAKLSVLNVWQLILAKLNEPPEPPSAPAG